MTVLFKAYLSNTLVFDTSVKRILKDPDVVLHFNIGLVTTNLIINIDFLC